MPRSSSELVPVAETDVFLLGLRRSGIHAIISWLIPHLPGLTRFVNDPVFEPTGGEPLEGRPSRYYFTKRGHSTEVVLSGEMRAAAEAVVLDDTRAYLDQMNGLARPLMRRLLHGFKKFRRDNPLRPPLIPYRLEAANEVRADFNLFAIENLTPGEFARIYPRWREAVYRPWLEARGLAPAPRARIILVLREPWNQLASLIKNPPNKPPRIIAPEDYLPNWLDYAVEFAGERDLLRAYGEVLPILYPRWFKEPGYRAELAAGLGVAPSDFGLNVVSDFGGGSSFDGQALAGRAQEMKVGERWKAYAEHPLMRRLCADARVNELSLRIFGTPAPGPAAAEAR